MSTSDWTTEDLRLAREALATGAKRVKYKNREVEYNEPHEIRITIREIETCLSGKPKSDRLLSRFSKGLC